MDQADCDSNYAIDVVVFSPSYRISQNPSNALLKGFGRYNVFAKWPKLPGSTREFVAGQAQLLDLEA